MGGGEIKCCTVGDCMVYGVGGVSLDELGLDRLR